MRTDINKDWTFGLQSKSEIDFDVDITWDQIHSMEAQANAFLDAGRQSTKQERRLAKNLLRAVKWIKRELYTMMKEEIEEDFKKRVYVPQKF